MHRSFIRLWVNRMAGAICSLLLVLPPAAAAPARIKDIVNVEGIRDNILIGYGLVVGLNGTGDKLGSNPYTEQSLVSFLDRLGINIRGQDLKSRNVAAVTVTATLPGFARHGSQIDVSVSALGDAKSLLGGTLLATPLYGADGEVYAVGQGQVTIGGFSVQGDSGTTINKGVPTNGEISNGAIVEREIAFDMNGMETVKLALRNPDITTARRIANTINLALGVPTARMTDPGTVGLSVPPPYRGDVVNLIADIEQLQVEPDNAAKIVIDEATGTIVMGENVRVDTVAVAQGNLVIRVNETPQVSQPNPFAPDGAETVEVPRTDIFVDENSDARLTTVNTGASLQDLVSGLNALGVGPRDLITILQTIKAAGALQADIESR